MTTQLELSALKRAWIDESVFRFHSFSLNRFTVDDLRQLLKEAPKANWYGCLIASLRCSGKIKEVGRVRSNRAERNGAKISLWETTR